MNTNKNRNYADVNKLKQMYLMKEKLENKYYL